MDDHDLTTIVDRVAADYWNSRIFLDGRKPWEEVDLDDQNAIKVQILPFVFRTVPLVHDDLIAKMNRSIAQAREQGFHHGEVLSVLATDFGLEIA